MDSRKIRLLIILQALSLSSSGSPVQELCQAMRAVCSAKTDILDWLSTSTYAMINNERLAFLQMVCASTISAGACQTVNNDLYDMQMRATSSRLFSDYDICYRNKSDEMDQKTTL